MICDDDDVQRQCCKHYAQANMLARKFHMCTDEVKVSLFRAYCTPFYTAHLWCKYRTAKLRKLQVAYNDAFRILLKLPRWTSASTLFVTSNVPTFHALLRNLIYKFMCRLLQSKNEVIMSLTDTKLIHGSPLGCGFIGLDACMYFNLCCHVFVLSFLYGTLSPK